MRLAGMSRVALLLLARLMRLVCIHASFSSARQNWQCQVESLELTPCQAFFWKFFQEGQNMRMSIAEVRERYGLKAPSPAIAATVGNLEARSGEAGE
jgi:hypothetical protein